MEHIEEQVLDLFVLSPEQIEEGRRATIRKHLESCEACHAFASLLQEYHRAMERPRKVSPALIDVLAAQIAPAPNVIHLRLQQVGSQANQSQVALAKPGDRFVTIARFIANTHVGAAVLQRNPTSDQFRIEYQAGNVVPRAWGIVTLGGIAECVLDEGYRAQFTVTEHHVPERWESVDAVVRFPAATVRAAFRPIPGGRAKVIDAPRHALTVKVRSVAEGTALEIIANEPSRRFSRVSFVDQAGAAKIVRLDNGTCVLTRDEEAEEQILNVYE